MNERLEADAALVLRRLLRLVGCVRVAPGCAQLAPDDIAQHLPPVIRAACDLIDRLGDDTPAGCGRTAVLRSVAEFIAGGRPGKAVRA